MIYYNGENWLYFPRTAYAPRSNPRSTLYLRNTSTLKEYQIKSSLSGYDDFWAYPVVRADWRDLPEGQYTYRLAPAGCAEEIGLLQIGAPANSVTEYDANITFKEYDN